MLTIKRDLRDETNLEDVKILPLADFHIGDPNADIPLIKRLIKQVEETDNMYTILNGDLMNTAINSSCSDSYSEVMKPSEQLKRCVDYFGGIAEQGKILAITDGNHERRISRSVGVDMTELLAAQLGVPNLYTAGDVLLFLQVGYDPRKWNKKGKRRPLIYAVFARHGAGGGALKGGKVNRLQRFSDVADADLYIGSHTHDDIVMHDAIYRVSRQTGKVRLCDRTYVNTPASLNYGGYGEIAGYRPQSNKHWPVITLHSREHLITVEV